MSLQRPQVSFPVCFFYASVRCSFFFPEDSLLSTALSGHCHLPYQSVASPPCCSLGFAFGAVWVLSFSSVALKPSRIDSPLCCGTPYALVAFKPFHFGDAHRYPVSLWGGWVFPPPFLDISVLNVCASLYYISSLGVHFWMTADCVWLHRPRLLSSHQFPWGGGPSPSFSSGLGGHIVISPSAFPLL